MRSVFWTAVALLIGSLALAAQAPTTGITRLVEYDLSRFPARTGLYVKHLASGEEIAVRADEAFSSASVIKIPIMVRAYQLAEAGTLDLDERTLVLAQWVDSPSQNIRQAIRAVLALLSEGWTQHPDVIAVIQPMFPCGVGP